MLGAQHLVFAAGAGLPEYCGHTLSVISQSGQFDNLYDPQGHPQIGWRLRSVVGHSLSPQRQATGTLRTPGSL